MAKILNDLKIISISANIIRILSIIRTVLTVGIIAFSVMKTLSLFKDSDNRIETAIKKQT